MIHAVIGGLMIATIANGMTLSDVSDYGLEIVTGLVLLAAVIVHSVARRSSANSAS